jgi:hypothetical protein
VRVIATGVRVVAFFIGVAQLLWISRYVLDLFGIVGLVVAWLFFPITLVVSPFYGVIAHNDWLGVAFFLAGPVISVVFAVFWRPEPNGGTVSISRFGAFGPGTGLVLAMDEQVASLDEAGWRRLAFLTIAEVGSNEPDTVLAAYDAIRSQAHGMDSTFLIQANRWTRTTNETRLARLPDEWFSGTMNDGRPAMASGVKSVIADRLAVAATAFAGFHFATQEQVAEAYAPVGFVLDFSRLLDRGATVQHPQLIAPYQTP